jgi:hypothetical protein
MDAKAQAVERRNQSQRPRAVFWGPPAGSLRDVGGRDLTHRNLSAVCSDELERGSTSLFLSPLPTASRRSRGSVYAATMSRAKLDGGEDEHLHEREGDLRNWLARSIVGLARFSASQ